MALVALVGICRFRFEILSCCFILQVSPYSEGRGGEYRRAAVNSACPEAGAGGNAGSQSALEHVPGAGDVLLPRLRVSVQADEELLLGRL